jgi:hypothetical protein
MADLTLATPASAVFVKGSLTRIRSQLTGTAGILPSQAVYTDPTVGRIFATTSLTAGKYAFRGISVNLAVAGAGPGIAVDIVEEGYVAGYDLSALAYDAPVYLSDTPGNIGTAAGTNSVTIGRVVALTDKDPVTGLPSKILYIRPSAF